MPGCARVQIQDANMPSKAGEITSPPAAYRLHPRHQHVKRRRHPVEEAGPPEPERDEPEQVGEQVIRAAVPAARWPFDNPAHAVYANKRTKTPTAASKINAKIPIVTNHIRFMFPSSLGRGMMAEMS